VGSVRQGGADLIGGEVVLCHDGVHGLACGEKTNDRDNVHASAVMQGFPNRTSGFIVIPGKTSMNLRRPSSI
jgi:hypothetical protein